MSSYSRANFSVAHHEATAEYVSFKELKLGVPYPLVRLTRANHEKYKEGIRALLRSPDNPSQLLTTYLPRRCICMSQEDFDHINNDCSRPDGKCPSILVTAHVNKTSEFEFLPPN